MPSRPLLITAALGGCVILSVLQLNIAAAEPGDLWEVTTEMKMAGTDMQMPARTQKVCSPKQSDQPAGIPKPELRDCEMYDLQRAGGKVSWKMRCSGKHPASGSGEMNYEGKERYDGVMKMNAAGHDMEMRLNGRRIGECDAAEQKQQIARVQEQAAAAQTAQAQYTEQLCSSAVETMNYFQLRPENGMCDAKYKTQFCKRYASQEGFETLMMGADQPAPGTSFTRLQEAETVCGQKAEDLRGKLCAAAMQKDSLVFIARNCPDLAQPIAQRECAGRGFTSPPAANYQEFCRNYAVGR